MPETVTRLLIKAETIQQQGELLGQHVGAVWSACLAQKQMMQLRRVLQLRSDLTDVPPQNSDVGHVDGNDALGIVLGVGDSECSRAKIQVIWRMAIEAGRCDLANSASSGISENNQSVIGLVDDGAS